MCRIRLVPLPLDLRVARRFLCIGCALPRAISLIRLVRYLIISLGDLSMLMVGGLPRRERAP